MVHPTLIVECQNARWKRVAGRTAGSLRCINWQTRSWGFVTTATAGSTYNSDLTHLAAFLENNTRRNNGLRTWVSRLMNFESLSWKICTQLHTWDGVALSTLANTSKYIPFGVCTGPNQVFLQLPCHTLVLRFAAVPLTCAFTLSTQLSSQGFHDSEKHINNI